MESTAPAAETLETAAAIEPPEAGSAAPETPPTSAPEAPKAGAPRPARTPAAATPPPPTPKPGELLTAEAQSRKLRYELASGDGSRLDRKPHSLCPGFGHLLQPPGVHTVGGADGEE